MGVTDDSRSIGPFTRVAPDNVIAGRAPSLSGDARWSNDPQPEVKSAGVGVVRKC